MTKFQRLTIILTVVNLGLLAFALAHLRPADAQGVAPVSGVARWKSSMTMGVFVQRSRYSGTTSAQDA